ncbi:hypothetical protein SFC12_04375 [Lactococcus lactis]|uniref:hypothetical protein n=1 Tax=Lactococcus lactis TaxID=1358 RepID=UPI0039829B88
MEFIKIFNSLNHQNIPFLQLIFILTLFLMIIINIKTFEDSLKKILSLKKFSITLKKFILVTTIKILATLLLFSLILSLLALVFYSLFKTNLSWVKVSLSLLMFFNNLICITPIWILLYCKLNSITAWSIKRKFFTFVKKYRHKGIYSPMNINSLTFIMIFAGIATSLSNIFDDGIAVLILLTSFIYFIFRTVMTSPHKSKNKDHV